MGDDSGGSAQGSIDRREELTNEESNVRREELTVCHLPSERKRRGRIHPLLTCVCCCAGGLAPARCLLRKAEVQQCSLAVNPSSDSLDFNSQLECCTCLEHPCPLLFLPWFPPCLDEVDRPCSPTLDVLVVCQLSFPATPQVLPSATLDTFCGSVVPSLAPHKYAPTPGQTALPASPPPPLPSPIPSPSCRPLTNLHPPSLTSPRSPRSLSRDVNAMHDLNDSQPTPSSLPRPWPRPRPPYPPQQQPRPPPQHPRQQPPRPPPRHPPPPARPLSSPGHGTPCSGGSGCAWGPWAPFWPRALPGPRRLARPRRPPPSPLGEAWAPRAASSP